MSPGIPPLPQDMRCEGFRTRLHFRAELEGHERFSFDRHAALCRPCAELLLEAERLDDLLLQWHAGQEDRRAEGVGPDDSGVEHPFEEGVLKALRGEGPLASCAESMASLHHLIAGDLEPWLAARVERHLAKCRDCADHLDEVRHSRKLWLSWRAPDPRREFADELIQRLEPERRAARRRRQILEIVFGPVRVPRAVAALVLVSVTLLSLGVLEMRGMLRVPVGTPPNVFDHQASLESTSLQHNAPVALQRNANVPIVPAQFAPGGRGDPTGSFSPELRSGRPKKLRSALRQPPPERAEEPPPK